MPPSDHVEHRADWTEAAALIAFEPRRPSFRAGFELGSLAVHVMDHRKRRLPVGARSLEAHYGGFVLSQQRLASANAAQRRALSTPYGPAVTSVRVGGYEGRSYPLGPELAEEAPDGRNPAVVVWSDGPMLYLLASDRLAEAELLRVASSL